MTDLNTSQMKNVIKDMRIKQLETAKEVLNITSNAIRIHELSNLKDKNQRNIYKSMLKEATNVLNLLDSCDAVHALGEKK